MSTIIIDSGSCFIKADFAGEDVPQYILKSIYGMKKPDSVLDKTEYVADEAEKNSASLDIRYPIVRGVVTNWDDIEKIWDYILLEKMKAKMNEHPVLVTEKPDYSKADREKTAQILFEKFNSPAMYIANESVLALYANGLQNGIVLSSGEGVTNFVVVKDYYAVRDSTIHLDFAGSDLTGYLDRMLNDKGFSFKTTAEIDILREIKHKLCYVSSEFDKELQNAEKLKAIYDLPDGQRLVIDDERIKCSEALFQPSLAGFKYDGVQKVINDSIMKCDENLRRTLYSNVVVAGGTTMFSGFVERLQKEITVLAPGSTKVSIKAAQHRNYAAWIGGSLLASMPTFKQISITKQEYDENGVNILLQKLIK